MYARDRYIDLIRGRGCVPSFDAFPRWLSSLLTCAMPPAVFRGSPLPELYHDAHSQWVFTHRGVFDIPANLRVTDTVSEDYERYSLIHSLFFTTA
jgi:hypothetical protein